MKNVIISIFIFSLLSCKKFVLIDPPKTQIITATVFNDDATAISAISGIYHEMYNNEGFLSGNTRGITFLSGFSSDELTNFNSNQDVIQFASNSLLETNTILKTNLWDQGYKFIYYANSVLEGLSRSTRLTSSVKNQLQGEAKFIRGLCHFYLTNLFGSIPYVTTIDYRINNSISKTGQNAVYDLVLTDLKEAQLLLPEDYNFAGGERVRPNKYVATALLARIYLYSGKWAEAETESTILINNTLLYTLSNDLNNVFLKNSTEAILQFKPILNGRNTTEANFFILVSAPVTAAINNQLINAFESGDNRFANWISSVTPTPGNTYYFPYKYKQGPGSTSVTEYSMLLRLAEQYLIRAEARAQLENLEGAQDDINILRLRAGLSEIDLHDKSALLIAVEHERQVELFTEYAHRWFDLKRTGIASDVLTPVKGAEWQQTDTIYPIPKSEIQTNPNLAPQNIGY